MKNATKILLSVLAALGLVILASSFILPDILEPKLRRALIGEFYEQSNEQYQLELASINISIWGREISADSIAVKTTDESLEIKHIKASSILIDGIQWFTLFSQRFPRFRSVTVSEPDAELYTRRISSAKPNPESPSANNSDITLSTFDVFIKSGKGKIVERDGNVVFSLESFDLSAREVNLNTILQGAYVPYLQDLSFSGAGLFWNLEEEFYHFTVDDFAFNKESKAARVEGLSFTPIVPKYDFAKFKGQQLDRFDLTVQSIQMENVDLDSLFIPSINLSNIIIESANLEVFHDKHMPPGPGIRFKPLLNDVAKQFGFSFGIDKLEVKNSNIAYGEHLPGSDNPGFITFADLDATITGFYTAEHPKFGEDSLRLDVMTRFMDASILNVDLAYAVQDKDETHTLKASLNEMDGTVLNGMLVNTAFTRIDRGYIHNLLIDLTLTDSYARGKMWLEYEDLKITALDENDATNTNFKTRLKSLIANTFVMRSDNMGEDMKVAEIDYPRPKDKAIFGYWWKSIQSGLEETIK
ncbi:MAG: hypothetical protein JJ971_12440 [Balneolaceae bacterium]|nr:hypothetical protein [Balneolaceae bacterium]MBO6547340.1 hypothetical protein [Balneolaceae bacterium]MBO6647713.1 hypothetical protein [Balneolaceae bacterium]